MIFKGAGKRAARPNQRWRWSGCRREKINAVMLRVKLLLPVLFLLPAIPPSAALSGDKEAAAEQAGATLFREKGCSYCHGEGGTGGKKGPSLAGLSTDKQWTAEKITSQILNGGQKMPPFGDSVTDEEIAQLVAYLRARNRPAPPPEPAAQAGPR